MEVARRQAAATFGGNRGSNCRLFGGGSNEATVGRCEKR